MQGVFDCDLRLSRRSLGELDARLVCTTAASFDEA